MATVLEYVLFAALIATVIIIAGNARRTMHQPHLRPAIAEPARP